MLTEDQGTQAVIDLQAVVNIIEPEEQARKIWARFSDMDKKVTEHAHYIVCGGFNEHGESNYPRRLRGDNGSVQSH